jgi:hypothetical protein
MVNNTLTSGALIMTRWFQKFVLAAVFSSAFWAKSCSKVQPVPTSGFSAVTPSSDASSHTQITTFGKYSATQSPSEASKQGGLGLDFWVRPGFPELAVSISYLNKNGTEGIQNFLLSGDESRRLFLDMKPAKVEKKPVATEKFSMESKLAILEAKSKPTIKAGYERKMRFNFEKTDGKRSILKLTGAFLVNERGSVYRAQLKVEKPGLLGIGWSTEYEGGFAMELKETGVFLEEQFKECRITQTQALIENLTTKSVQERHLLPLCN